MKKEQPVIIIKKKGHGHGGHHGGAWKGAYADFVTAMMAVFLVMWIVGERKPMKGGVGRHVRDPGGVRARHRRRGRHHARRAEGDHGAGADAERLRYRRGEGSAGAGGAAAAGS